MTLPWRFPEPHTSHPGTEAPQSLPSGRPPGTVLLWDCPPLWELASVSRRGQLGPCSLETVLHLPGRGGALGLQLPRAQPCAIRLLRLYLPAGGQGHRAQGVTARMEQVPEHEVGATLGLCLPSGTLDVRVSAGGPQPLAVWFWGGVCLLGTRPGLRAHWNHICSSWTTSERVRLLPQRTHRASCVHTSLIYPFGSIWQIWQSVILGKCLFQPNIYCFIPSSYQPLLASFFRWKNRLGE